MSFFKELKRRNVIKVAIAYLAVAWLLLQIADVVLPTFGTPGWVMQAFTFLLILGLPPALLFAWAFELTPDGVKRERDVVRAESITHHTGRKLDFVIIAVLFLAVSFLLLDKFAGPSDSDSQQAIRKSIAVLPFVNMSDDEGNEYFSDGISEEILNALAKVKDLNVAGRTSSFAFKGRNEDLRTIGEALSVSYILEGSVRKADEQVRITAQLVKADDGYHLWSAAYDRELTDIFAIQDEIATEILKQLKAQLLDEERQGLASQRTDSEVYDLYLLARQRLYSRSPQFIESALELLDKAISMDPSYAPAYAQRGIAQMFLADDSYGTIPRAESYPLGKQYVETALELNPNLAEAWAGLGLFYVNQPTQHEQAISALEKALSINPNLIDASNWLHIALSRLGEPRAALHVLKEMTQKDPLYLPGFANSVRYHDYFGEEGEAQALIDHYREYDPNNLHLLHLDAEHLLNYGRAAEALVQAERSLAGGPSDANAQLFFSNALLRTLQLERIAEEGSGEYRVVALELLGRRDEAFELAHSLTSIGDLETLFWLFNRAGHSQDLVNYVEERWPNLESLANGYRYTPEGYSMMTNVAFAYSKVDNLERFAAALSRAGDAMTYLADQGIDNWMFMLSNAEYLALAERYEESLTQLQHAIDRGMLMCVPLAEFSPIFEPLRNNPRLVAAETAMSEKINDERMILGLEPVNTRDNCRRKAAVSPR